MQCWKLAVPALYCNKNSHWFRLGKAVLIIFQSGFFLMEKSLKSG